MRTVLIAIAFAFSMVALFTACKNDPQLYVFETDGAFDNEKVASGLFLIDRGYSLELFRPASIFMSFDYETDTAIRIHQFEYLSRRDTLRVSKTLGSKQIETVTVNATDTSFVMYPVQLTPLPDENALQLTESKLTDKLFISMIDSALIYLGSNHQYYVRKEGLFKRYNWYTLEILGDHYLVMDTFQRNLAQVTRQDGTLALYSLYYDKVVAMETKPKIDKREQLDFQEKTRGKWRPVRHLGLVNAEDFNLIITDSTLITYHDKYPDYKSTTGYRFIPEVQVIEFENWSYLTVDEVTDSTLVVRGNWSYLRRKWGDYGKEITFRRVK